MILRIRHRISYTYDRPVFLEPSTVRLRPRCDCAQSLLDHELVMVPEPAGMAWAIDAEGNDVATAWFEGSHGRLRIDAESLVRTTRTDPFEYLITDEAALELPVQYTAENRAVLDAYRERQSPHAAVDNLAEEVARQARNETQRFLASLSTVIHDRCTPVSRRSGLPEAPAVTLAAAKGACRDLAVLFVDACRAVGIAARFVSGYKLDDGSEGPSELHAWAEVYLPGAGWRGYDPSVGLATADRHVALASAREAAAAAPTSGTYRGTDARSRMRTTVSLAEEAPEGD